MNKDEILTLLDIELVRIVEELEGRILPDGGERCYRYNEITTYSG